jgi:tripartite-type tricarboxylate transporter receptor subunit TctC
MGFPNISTGGWIGFFVPGNTPDAVAAKLNSEINLVVQDPRAQEFMKKRMFEPVVKNVSEVENYFESDVESWRTMLRAISN